MGCASSKQARCRHCQSPYSPLPRSYTVHHPAQSEEDSYHVVALTSTTLGSLKLDSSNQNHHHRHYSFNSNDFKNDDNNFEDKNNENNDQMMKEKEFSLVEEVNRAKSWSQMISEKIPKFIPKTPTRTPPGEPETINTWELMEGLEDYSPLRFSNQVGRSFSFHAIPHSSISINSPPKSKLQENDEASPLKPIRLQTNENVFDSISDFDPDIISTFRKALEELSPANPFHLRQPEKEKLTSPKIQPLFTRDDPMDMTKEKVTGTIRESTECPQNGEHKVVIYFTSLRGVRKTYEDCCHVRVILKGFGVRIDERDVSMHSGFREELKELLGAEFRVGGLPRVFVNGRYIGGAEEIRQFHEDGELEKILEKCEKEEEGGGICEACGDIRFVPCERCSGSCKIYYEVEEEEEEEEDDVVGLVAEFGFQRCPDCNENGLIRCPICCCS